MIVMFRADMIRPNSVRVSWRFEMIGLATAAGANVTNCIWNCTSRMMESTIQREAESFSLILTIVASVTEQRANRKGPQKSPGSSQHQATASASVGREK